LITRRCGGAGPALRLLIGLDEEVRMNKLLVALSLAAALGGAGCAFEEGEQIGEAQAEARNQYSACLQTADQIWYEDTASCGASDACWDRADANLDFFQEMCRDHFCPWCP
jgi:hypothetical protein